MNRKNLLKGCCKKNPFSNFVTSAYISTKKMIHVNLCSKGYGNSKGFAIVQDFTAHWAIKNKQMASVWNLIYNQNHNS
jgi:hypothetical protein